MINMNTTQETRMTDGARHRAKALLSQQRKPKPSGKGFKRRQAQARANYFQAYAIEVDKAYRRLNEQYQTARRRIIFLCVAQVLSWVTIGVLL